MMLQDAELSLLNLRYFSVLVNIRNLLIVLPSVYRQRESGQGVCCSRISLPALVLYFVYLAK